MTPEQLERLYNRHGYTLVWNLREYAAFRPEDIEEQQVREGARYVCSFSVAVLDTISVEAGERFLAHAEALGTDWPNNVPFDTSTPYQIGLPKTHTVPEWQGWPIGRLREIWQK